MNLLSLFITKTVYRKCIKSKYDVGGCDAFFMNAYMMKT